MKDTKELLWNVHTTNKPLYLAVGSLIGGLIIASLVVVIGLGSLAVAYWFVSMNPDMTNVVYGSLALGCAGIVSWLTCFLTSRKG